MSEGTSFDLLLLPGYILWRRCRNNTTPVARTETKSEHSTRLRLHSRMCSSYVDDPHLTLHLPMTNGNKLDKEPPYEV